MKKTTKTEALEVFHDSLRRWLSEVGRKGGSCISKAKAAAARENGRKGGRPRLLMCKRCRWIHDMRCPLPAWTRKRRFYDPDCRLAPVCDLYEDMSRAKPASLKLSRIGRCKPASDGSRPSKRKNRS